ncbi:MAG: biotin synthase BioB [Muribaculaceae bacterium]|nr:biotin synthase BioB [Muribaculaceae bacterium]
MEHSSQKDIAIVADALGKVLAGETLGEDTLYVLSDIDSPEGKEALIEGAAEITLKYCPRKFDSCSIVNARSGRCSENCKWCAQSAHFKTACSAYELVDHDEARRVARYNAERGVGRFSLVASGKAAKGKALDHFCRILREVRDEDHINTCASLGLLNEEELQQLWEAGARRYHCNLETAPSYFPSLCSTHTQAEKLATIAAARKVGFKICSGGIIGMGESRRQRMELAITLRQVEPVSIPINVLSPIPGTPLEHTEPISEDEIILTVALFRFAHPSTELRFAGGRARMSRASQLKALRTGINGGVVGDLLTTIGSTIAEDAALVKEAGYEF